MLPAPAHVRSASPSFLLCRWLWGTTALIPPLHPITLWLTCSGDDGKDSCLKHREGQGHPQSLHLPRPTRSDYSSLSLSWIVLIWCFLSTVSSELLCHLSPGSLLPVALFLPLLPWLLMRAICSTCRFIRQEQTRCTREKSIPLLFVGDWAMCFQISAHMYCHWFMFLRTTLSFAYKRLWFFQASLCLRLQLGFMFILWNMFPICICHCYLMKKLNIASLAGSSNGSVLIGVVLTDFLFRLW